MAGRFSAASPFEGGWPLTGLSGWRICSFSYRSVGDHETVTDLTGTLPDQSALQGVLNRIWNLNLTVLSVRTKAETGADQPTGRSK